ncbi:hypothetical protein [Shewanella sp. KCT]|uniref:hypothetical protein n=1 Tax=Shewanella sp. KCT TaxID=2569535 RepID=UPI0011831E8E|nr:hypothetical protein [Shewanella sp. KCT]TVP11784.1 hypothetical protein AYI87_15245 [Shewanella sp. KCT]
MGQRVDSGVLQLKPFGRHKGGEFVHVMRSQITHVTSYEANGNSGAEIHFVGGTSVVVGEWIGTVDKVLRG